MMVMDSSETIISKTPSEMLIGLNLYISRAHNHSYYELMSVVALSCPKDTISQQYTPTSHFWLLKVFDSFSLVFPES